MKKSERRLAWVAQSRDAEYAFDTELACDQWMAQPIVMGHFRKREVVVARCACCKLFHIQKPSESVAAVRAAQEGGK